MYRYRPGDRCPFCGQPIPADIAPDLLYVISIAAHAMKLPEPGDPQPELLCTLPASVCPSGQETDGRCCRACDKYGNCPDACLNNPHCCNRSTEGGTP